MEPGQDLDHLRYGDKKYNTTLMLGTGIYFGLRIGDILKLTWSQILSENFIIIESKTKKSRKIDVHKDYSKIVRKVARLCQIDEEDEQLVFTHQRSNGDQSRAISVVAANKLI